MHIIGEHDLEELNHRTRLTNLFTVEETVPGIERFFGDNFDGELDSLESALRKEVEAKA